MQRKSVLRKHNKEHTFEYCNGDFDVLIKIHFNLNLKTVTLCYENQQSTSPYHLEGVS